MAFAYLTRVVTFEATHQLPRMEEHGHDYRCEVTVRGPLDESTGMIIDLGALDRILAEEVVRRFSGRRLNDVIPQPTGEMLAFHVWKHISPRLPGTCTLESVKIAEDDTLWSEYRGE